MVPRSWISAGCSILPLDVASLYTPQVQFLNLKCHLPVLKFPLFVAYCLHVFQAQCVLPRLIWTSVQTSRYDLANITLQPQVRIYGFILNALRHTLSFSLSNSLMWSSYCSFSPLVGVGWVFSFESQQQLL